MKNQRFFNRQICADAQIRELSAAWRISVKNRSKAGRRFSFLFEPPKGGMGDFYGKKHRNISRM